MKYLCINTAGKNIEIALVYDSKRLFWFGTDFKQASVALLPQIDKMLGELNISLEQLDFFACVSGPGSFTGIRIGISTIRAFCYALNKKAIVINYLQLLAYNDNADDTESIISVIDGSNFTAYVGAYNSDRECLLQPKCLSHSQLSDFLQQVDEPNIVCVDDGIASVVKGCTPKTDGSSLMRAVEQAALNNDNFVDYNLVVPLYIRVSQAESELALKQNGI